VRAGNLVYLSGLLAKNDGKLWIGKLGADLEVFGERGAQALSAFGVAQIPFGSCVEIEMIVEAVYEESRL
jgi:hypothetical protein